jgi:hypothetical protein
MMRKSFAIGMAFAAVLAVGSFSVRAEDYDSAKLAQALSDASVSLEQGSRPVRLKASQSRANMRLRTARFSSLCTQ